MPPVVRKLNSNHEQIIQHIWGLHHAYWNANGYEITFEQLRTRKWVLVCFGGHFNPNTKQKCDLKDEWIIFYTQPEVPKDISTNTQLHVPLLASDPKLYFPDLIHHCKVVIGKLGFGLCGECLYHQTPLLYIPRKGFIEEEGLIKFMHDERYTELPSCFEMNEELFYEGKWQQFIDKLQLKKKEKQSKAQNFNGESFLYDFLFE